MDAINTLRAVLAGGAGVAAIVAALSGAWLTVAILAVGLVAHAWLWVQLARARARDRSPTASPATRRA